MVTFYPRDIGRWRQVFDFDPTPSLTPRLVPSAREGVTFQNRGELIQFLKSHGVRLDDPEHPLEFTRTFAGPPHLEGDVHAVIQWTLIGWMVDRYGS